MDDSIVHGLLIMIVAIPLYMLPSFVAAGRKCKAAAGIVVVNLFLGWTFIGWVVALAWAASGEATPRPDALPPSLFAYRAKEPE